MGLLSGVVEGTLAGDAKREILPRFAERARAGQFGTVRRTFDVEEVATAAATGYRDAARTPAIRLRAKPGQPASWFETVELDVDERGGLRYRFELGRARFLRLGGLGLFGLAAALIALVLLQTTGSMLLALPIMVSVVFMIASTISRFDAQWKKDVLATLRGEIDDARVDAALESTGVNIGVAQDVLARLDARAVALTDDERDRIRECDDAAVLAQWMQNAQVATSASEVFEAPRVRVDTTAAPEPLDDACAPSGPGVTTLDRGNKA